MKQMITTCLKRNSVKIRLDFSCPTTLEATLLYQHFSFTAEKKQKTPKGKNESGGGGDKKSPKPKKTQEADDEEQLALRMIYVLMMILYYNRTDIRTIKILRNLDLSVVNVLETYYLARQL